jgi:hypothetical protein
MKHRRSMRQQVGRAVGKDSSSRAFRESSRVRRVKRESSRVGKAVGKDISSQAFRGSSRVRKAVRESSRVGRAVGKDSSRRHSEEAAE